MYPKIRWEYPLDTCNYCNYSTPSYKTSTRLEMQADWKDIAIYQRVAKRLGITDRIVVPGDFVRGLPRLKGGAFVSIPEPDAGWAVFWQMVEEEKQCAQ